MNLFDFLDRDQERVDRHFAAEPPCSPWGVNFGGGVNSTALLLMLHDRHLRPDWVVFADTGSERPETYQNVDRVRAWTKEVGFPFDETRWIRLDGTFESVHANALRTHYLPSKAYGYSGCTWKWKIQPLQKWRLEHGFSPSGVAIAYDVGEKRRLKKARKVLCEDTERSTDEVVWYPLVGFMAGRAQCIMRILQQGWIPTKSACFCCPNTKPHEWGALAVEHPNLMFISQQIENGAKEAGNAETKSLFRSYDPKSEGCLCSADGCSEQEEIPV